ncbi:MAG: hypothetical protein AAGG51_06890 [Cyanobacteria bacterium P01_G01_bin.54]
MSDYAISRKKFEEVQKISPEHISISNSTIVFKQAKDSKKGKDFGVFFSINDIKHAAFCDYKVPKEDPPKFCTYLIIASLVLLLFPSYISLSGIPVRFLGILGFIILFFILAQVDAKNAKRGKYGLFLSLSGGLEFIVESKNDLFLKTTLKIIDAIKNQSSDLMSYLDGYNSLILNLKDKKIIDSTNKKEVKIDDLFRSSMLNF